MSKDELRLFRRQQVDDYRHSGLSAETWCEANAMKVSTLRYWLRRFKEIDQPQQEQAWAAIKLIGETGANNSTPVVIMVKGFEINLHPGFEPTVLTTVLQTIQRL